VKVLVGTDAGGTKLAIRVTTVDGVALADARYPADDWSASPVDSAARWLLDRVRRAVPDGDDVVAAGIGAQGCDTREHCVALADAVAALGVPAVVVNDAALLVPAAGLDAGIGVVAGTGSIGVGTDADGGVLFAGGWGWVLGDEGSAPAILREATKTALRACDADDGLLSALLAHYGVAGPQALARAVNDEPTTANWGPGATAFFAAADAGSALAARVVDDAAGHLAGLVGQLVRRGAVGDTVVAAGGVLRNQPRLAERFAHHLAGSHPGLTVHLLDVPPVAGGVVLARRYLNPTGR
jgi:N-acetylglucosamine kinase-like BadF-type ATPase